MNQYCTGLFFCNVLMVFRAWYQLHVFPSLAPVANFPAFGTCTVPQMQVFPRFSALIVYCVFSFAKVFLVRRGARFSQVSITNPFCPQMFVILSVIYLTCLAELQYFKIYLSKTIRMESLLTKFTMCTKFSFRAWYFIVNSENRPPDHWQ